MINKRVVSLLLDNETIQRLDEIKSHTGILKSKVVEFGVRLFQDYVNKDELLNFQKEIMNDKK